MDTHNAAQTHAARALPTVVHSRGNPHALAGAIVNTRRAEFVDTHNPWLSSPGDSQIGHARPKWVNQARGHASGHEHPRAGTLDAMGIAFAFA